jgi:hypothetical protein
MITLSPDALGADEGALRAGAVRAGAELTKITNTILSASTARINHNLFIDKPPLVKFKNRVRLSNDEAPATPPRAVPPRRHPKDNITGLAAESQLRR